MSVTETHFIKEVEMMDFTGKNIFSQTRELDYSECLPKWAKDEGLFNVEDCNRICRQSFVKRIFGFFA